MEGEITEQTDKERVAAHIPQELQDEAARNNREPPQSQPHPSSQLLQTGLPMSPRNPSSALQGPLTPTLSHTITYPVHSLHPSALAHSSNNLDLTSTSPTPSAPFISDTNRGSGSSVPRAAAILTIKKADASEISLENVTKSTPTPSPESEDQLLEQEVEADDIEKVVAEHKAEVADEIRKLEEATWLEKENERYRKQEEWLRKDVEPLELQRLKEEEERRLNLKQGEEGVLEAEQEETVLQLAQERPKEEKERKEEREEQDRLSKLAEETRLRLEEEAAAKVKAGAISEPEPEEGREAELEAHKGDRKEEGQFEDGKTTSINSPTSDKQRPGPLDLTGAIRSASPFVAPLAAARFITDIATVSYPEGYQGPHPDLNKNVKNGKFRYH